MTTMPRKYSHVGVTLRRKEGNLPASRAQGSRIRLQSQPCDPALILSEKLKHEAVETLQPQVHMHPGLT